MCEQKMCLVEPEAYEQLRPLFVALETIHLNVTAALDGSCLATVYADDLEDPGTALLISDRLHYLAGVTDNRGFNAAVHAALPRDTYFVLICDPQRWAGALNDIVDGTYAVRARSHYYRLAKLKADDWQDRIPAGFSMERMDANLLAQGLEGADGMVDGILEEWNSLDAFLERGFGCCVVHGTRVVSWSFADYVSADRCEIGIYTDGDYRRRGLGTLTAAANATQAVARGFSSIGWHCWDNNVGSIRVAENVGFVKAGAYDVSINHWPALNVSDMTRAEFRAFAQRYEREFEARPPASGFPHVVAAKAWALGGDRAGCFRQLHNAVDVGWLRSVEQLCRIWPELWFNPHLEEMDEWQGLARRLEPGGARAGGGGTPQGPQ